MEAVLELESVTKRFGETRALAELTLRVAPGECLGLVGRNGAGKTTAIRLAAGLLEPTSGRVSVFNSGYRADGLAIRRRIGVMPQDDALLEALTPRQYLELVGRLHRLERPVIDRRRTELCETLEIESPPEALTSELSFGTRKKLALAAALLGRPELVLLDEPFEGIDPVASATLRALFDQLRRRGVALLLSSHQLGEVERLATRVAILDHGRLVAAGTWDELRAATPEAEDLESLFEALVGGRRPVNLSWL